MSPVIAPFDDSFAYLFNSYYEAEGARHTRSRRGLMTRPSLTRIFGYRSHVDAAIENRTGTICRQRRHCAGIELGIHHEQQHQELLLTDILHLFSQNPTYPAYWPEPALRAPTSPDVAAPMEWMPEGPSGSIFSYGDDGHAVRAGQALRSTAKARAMTSCCNHLRLPNRTVTNGEWMQFMV